MMFSKQWMCDTNYNGNLVLSRSIYEVCFSFNEQNISPIDNHCNLTEGCGDSTKRVQHVRKWCIMMMIALVSPAHEGPNINAEQEEVPPLGH